MFYKSILHIIFCPLQDHRVVNKHNKPCNCESPKCPAGKQGNTVGFHIVKEGDQDQRKKDQQIGKVIIMYGKSLDEESHIQQYPYKCNDGK